MSIIEVNIKKETHIERSDGDTDFLSVKNCPLTPSGIAKDTNVLNSKDYVCCINGEKDYKCPHFWKFIQHGNKMMIQCSKIGEPDNNGHPEFTIVPK